MTAAGTIERTSVFAARKARATELASRFAYAAEPLLLFAALTDAQSAAYDRALKARPSLAAMPAFVVRESLPGVMETAMSMGTETVREAVLTRFHEGDLEEIVRTWVAGGELTATDAFLARAANDDNPAAGGIVVEVLVECRLAREPHALLRHDAQARFLKAGNDLAREVATGCVGFDDGKRALDGHVLTPEAKVRAL